MLEWENRLSIGQKDTLTPFARQSVKASDCQDKDFHFSSRVVVVCVARVSRVSRESKAATSGNE